MANRPEAPADTAPGPVRYPAGTSLRCHSCGAEVRVTSPCPCDPPDMVLQCCGQDMRPTTEGA